MHDGPSTLTSRANAQAALSLYVFAVVDAVHIATAIAMAPAEKRTVVNVVGGLGMNLAVIVLVIWLACGVRRGRRLGAATAVLVFLLIGGIVSVAVALAFGYKGGFTLALVQILFGISIFGALFFVIRALLRGTDDRTVCQR